MMLFNMEVRYPIYKKFGGTLFWDMGNVWSTYEEANAFKLRQGAGIGLRYNSPLGIVRVDIGVKIDRKKDENAGEIYFTLGQIF